MFKKLLSLLFKKKQTKKFYITSTLPYPNSKPHIGFAMEIIRADILARQKRILLGEKKCFFLIQE